MTNYHEVSPSGVPGVSGERGLSSSPSSFLISDVHHHPNVTQAATTPEDHPLVATRSRAPRSFRINDRSIDRRSTWITLESTTVTTRCVASGYSLSPSVTRALITHPSPALPTRRTTCGGDDDDGDDDDDDVDDREVGGELARDDTRVTVDDESSRSDEEILGGRQAGWLAAGGTRGGSPGGERETEDEGE